MKKFFCVAVVALFFVTANAEKGQVVSFEYPFCHGYRVTGVPDEEFDLNGYVYGNIIDGTGLPVLEKEWLIGDLSDIEGCEDIILIIDDSSEMNIYGFFDRSSGYFCEPKYDGISLYTQNSEKLIAVSCNELWGFCERNTGRILIPICFDGVFCDFQNGYAIVIEEGKSLYYSEEYSLINQSGEPVLFPEDIMPVSTPNKEGYLIIADYTDENPLYGIGNTKGEIVIQPCYMEEPSLESVDIPVQESGEETN